MALRIGYKASAEQFGARELVELAVSAEAHGFDSVAVSDHFQPWRRDGGHAPFSLAWAAAVGARTTEIAVGTSVLTPTFRYNPAVVAQAFATLAELTPGRVWLGVGSGEALNEVSAGLPLSLPGWPPFADRLGRLREAVTIIQSLWRGEKLTFDGDWFRTEDAVLFDLPPEPVPLLIAAGGPTTAEFAGSAGAGLICTSGKGRELYEGKLLPAFAVGRDSAHQTRPVERMIEIKVSYETSLAAARENTRFWAPLSLSAEQKATLTDPDSMEQAASALPLDEVTQRWIVGADADEVVAAIGDYVGLGFDHLLLHAPGRDQRRFMELFDRDLAPRLRAL